MALAPAVRRAWKCTPWLTLAKRIGPRRAGQESLANHHAGLGPFVGVVQTVHPGDDRTIAGKLLVDEPALIGRIVDIGAGAVHQDVVGRQLQEPGGLTPEPQGEGIGPVGGPILSGRPSQLRLGVADRAGIVVGQGHRLFAAVDDGRFAEGAVGGRVVTDLRTVDLGAIAIEPGIEDAVGAIVVALEVIDRDVRIDSETPDLARPEAGGLGGIDLVHAPVVGPSQAHRRGREAGFGRRPGQNQGVGIGAEVDLMRGGFTTGPPTE